nr:hypothetical protein [Streptomyces marincola]
MAFVLGPQEVHSTGLPRARRAAPACTTPSPKPAGPVCNTSQRHRPSHRRLLSHQQSTDLTAAHHM